MLIDTKTQTPSPPGTILIILSLTKKLSRFNVTFVSKCVFFFMISPSALYAAALGFIRLSGPTSQHIKCLVLNKVCYVFRVIIFSFSRA